MKYKIWHNARKEWVHTQSYVFINPEGRVFVFTGYPNSEVGKDNLNTFVDMTDSVAVIYFTGLHDKNGKEIYEGDLLNHRTYVRSNLFRVGIVCYDEKQCTYKFVPFEAYESNAGNGGWTGFSFDYHICLEAEVIGNIYENPELLEETP